MSNTHTKDGSKTSFYNIAHCEDYDDLAEYLQLDGFEFNIGKSLFANLGNRHDGTNPQREAKKCLHYAIRRAFKQIGREEAHKMMQKYFAAGNFVEVEVNAKKEKLASPIKKISPTKFKVYNTIFEIGTEQIDPGTNVYIYQGAKGKPWFSTREYKNENLIGGFHYSLIPRDFAARNNIDEAHAKAIAGINAFSIWTQEHRPTCSPEGMAYDPLADAWIDIYMLGSKHDIYGTSAPHQIFLAGGNRCGRINPNGIRDFLYKDFENVAQKHGKRFITFDEFISATKGVKEYASAGDEDNGITTHNPDFVSRYGIEQATGHNWIWSEKIDAEKAVLLGGRRDDGVHAGSRASNWHYTLSFSVWGIGCRFACDSLKPAKMSESEFFERFTVLGNDA